MKMTKKLIFAALAVAAVIGFASCQKEIGEINWQGGVLGSGDGNTTFKVKQTNDSNGVIRGMKQVGMLDRATATCVITQKDQTSSTCNGMMGFACCFTQNKDKTKANNGTYNFLVVGVRNNGSVRETYASFFYNISEENLSKENFGAGTNVKEKYVENATEAYEVELVKFPAELLGVTLDSKGNFKIGIRLTEGESGDVLIEWMKDLTENSTAATTSGGTPVNVKLKTGGTIAYYQAKGLDIGRNATSTKGKICTYANIYAGETLNAQWDIYDISWSQDSSFSAEDDDFIEVGDVIFE